MRISLVILLSLATNVALALVLLHARHLPSSTTDDAQGSAGDAGAETSAGTAPARLTGAGLTSQISWSDLQVDDLKEFVGRLRVVGCPEETIKDLVLVELNRRYSVKQRAVWQGDQQQNDYWKPYKRTFDPAAAKKNRERSRQMQAMQKEKTALIVELFGVDVEKQRMKEEGYDTDYNGWNPNGNLAFLPEAKRDAVQKYLDDFQEKEQEFYASTMGGWDADARVKQKQLESDKLAGLAQILTPDELREYKLRNSQMASQLQSDLHGVDLTREQYEALFDIRSKYGDSIYNYGDAGNDAATIKQIEQNKKDMQAEIAVALGTDKSAELARAQDYQYQQLASLARHNDLPADTATKVYNFKSASEAAVKDLRANSDLTPEQRQAALAQIRAETEASVQAALGDKLYKRYLSNGGWWLNNIAPPARK